MISKISIIIVVVIIDVDSIDIVDVIVVIVDVGCVVGVWCIVIVAVGDIIIIIYKINNVFIFYIVGIANSIAF